MSACFCWTWLCQASYNCDISQPESYQRLTLGLNVCLIIFFFRNLSLCQLKRDQKKRINLLAKSSLPNGERNANSRER